MKKVILLAVVVLGAFVANLFAEDIVMTSDQANQILSNGGSIVTNGSINIQSPGFSIPPATSPQPGPVIFMSSVSPQINIQSMQLMSSSNLNNTNSAVLPASEITQNSTEQTTEQVNQALAETANNQTDSLASLQMQSDDVINLQSIQQATKIQQDANGKVILS